MSYGDGLPTENTVVSVLVNILTSEGKNEIYAFEGRIKAKNVMINNITKKVKYANCTIDSETLEKMQLGKNIISIIVLR